MAELAWQTFLGGYSHAHSVLCLVYLLRWIKSSLVTSVMAAIVPTPLERTRHSGRHHIYPIILGNVGLGIALAWRVIGGSVGA